MLMIASTDVLRQQNRALVLTALRQAQSASHTEIAKRTRLSSATVSSITADLEAEGVIHRLEPVRKPGRGRPRVLFELNAAAAYVAIVRITSDAVEYSLADYGGTLKDRFHELRPPQNDSVDAFVSRLSDSLKKLAERGGLDCDQIKTISISSKGVVAPDLPVLLWSPVFGSEQINFGSALGSMWKADIQLANETRFVAQSYLENKSPVHLLTKPRKIAVLSIGNSIGMGICTEEVSGRIESLAPAFSHMVHQVDGPLCRCGEQGCVEAYSAFYGIVRSALDAPEQSINASQEPLKTLDQIAQRARTGDLHAELAFRKAAEALGIGLSRVLSLFGEMPVMITGPGIRYLDLMLPTIQLHIQQNLYMRHQAITDVLVEENEPGLVYDGHLAKCLSDLDKRVLALGIAKISGV